MHELVFVGSVANEVSGLSAANRMTCHQLEKGGVPVRILDVSVAKNADWPAYLLFRALHYVKAIHALLRAPTGSVAYLPLNGGLGAAYDAILLAVIRARRMKCFLHHHTFSYINQPTWISKIVACLAGDATHVFLCKGMAAAYRRAIPHSSRGRFVTLSNLSLLEPSAEEPERREYNGGVIGHIGALCVGKGTDLFLSLFDRLSAIEPGVRGVLAGPMENEEIRAAVNIAIEKAAGRLRYIGVIGGAAKAEFYRSIDVLIAPSRLPEAQPMILLEAARVGVPFITFNVGCNYTDYQYSSNLILQNEFDLFEEGAAWVLCHMHDADRRAATLDGAAAHYAAMAAQAEDELEEWRREISFAAQSLEPTQ